MEEISPNSYKTHREMEKLLATSNFFFSPSVLKRLVLQTHKTQGLFGKGLSSGKYRERQRKTELALYPL